MSSTTTDTSVRSGVARLLDWLTRHPGIPISYISHVDDLSAEVFSLTGRFEAITAAADIADALCGPQIKVSDPPGKRETELTVWGRTQPGTPGVDICACVVVFDTARDRLLSSLGVARTLGTRNWLVTAAHLRSVADAQTAATAAGV